MPTETVRFRAPQGYPKLVLALSKVEGLGRVYPRLTIRLDARIDVGARHSGAMTMQGDDWPDEFTIHRLRVAVSCAGEMIAQGEMPLGGATIWLGTDSSVQIEVPISQAAIQWVDEAGRGKEVLLTLIFDGDVRCKASSNSSVVAVAAILEANSLPAVLPRSSWVHDVVEKLGTDNYVWMELPIPAPPDGARWRAALEHLHKAEIRYHEGADADVLGICWDSLEALSPGAGKLIVPPLADERKRSDIDLALGKFRSFLQNGRHPREAAPGEGGRYHVDHRDAQFALGVTKVYLTYVARLHEAG